MYCVRVIRGPLFVWQLALRQCRAPCPAQLFPLSFWTCSACACKWNDRRKVRRGMCCACWCTVRCVACPEDIAWMESGNRCPRGKAASRAERRLAPQIEFGSDARYKATGAPKLPKARSAKNGGMAKCGRARTYSSHAQRHRTYRAVPVVWFRPVRSLRSAWHRGDRSRLTHAMYDVRAGAAPQRARRHIVWLTGAAPSAFGLAVAGRTSRLWASAHATLLSSAVTMMMIYSV